MKKTPVHIFLIVALTILAYANTLGNEFVWDDSRFIVDRPEIRSMSMAFSSLSTDNYGIYRPLRTLLYASVYSLFGLNPALYHIMSVLFHSLAGILAYLVLSKIIGGDKSLIASLLFAVHPLHVERVANITGSFDIPGIILYLLAFYLYLKSRSDNEKQNFNPVYFWLSILTFAVGLFFSEEIFTLPLLILFFEFIFRRNALAAARPYLFFIPLILFIALRFFILGIGSRSEMYPAGSLAMTFFSMPLILLQYIFLVIFPFGFSPFRREYLSLHPFILIIALLIVAAIILIIHKKSSGELAFFSGWFFITLLPFLNFLPIQQAFAARYFYLSSIAAFVFIAFLFYRMNAARIPVLTIALLALIALAIYNNAFWKNEQALFERGIFLNPENPKAHNNLGTFYFKQDRVQEAILHFDKSIEIDSTYGVAWMNKGVALSRIGEYNSSIQSLQAALMYSPDNWEAYEKLGTVYMRSGDLGRAKDAYLQAIAWNKDYYPAYARLGVLYGTMGEYGLAEEYLKKSLEINPFYEEAAQNLIILGESRGK